MNTCEIFHLKQYMPCFRYTQNHCVFRMPSSPGLAKYTGSKLMLSKLTVEAQLGSKGSGAGRRWVRKLTNLAEPNYKVSIAVTEVLVLYNVLAKQSSVQVQSAGYLVVMQYGLKKLFVCEIRTFSLGI